MLSWFPNNNVLLSLNHLFLSKPELSQSANQFCDQQERLNLTVIKGANMDIIGCTGIGGIFSRQPDRFWSLFEMNSARRVRFCYLGSDIHPPNIKSEKGGGCKHLPCPSRRHRHKSLQFHKAILTLVKWFSWKLKMKRSQVRTPKNPVNEHFFIGPWGSTGGMLFYFLEAGNLFSLEITRICHKHQ